MCAGLPDRRLGTDMDYTMADIGPPAFSLFFMQSESFLFHQRRLEQGHVTSNCHTLFGIKKIPTDNYIRPMLDNVSPEAFKPCFDPGRLRQSSTHLELPMRHCFRPNLPQFSSTATASAEKRCTLDERNSGSGKLDLDLRR